MSWSFLVRQLTPAELAADTEYSIIRRRAKQLKRCKKAMSTRLAAALVQRETHAQYLDAAVTARAKIINLLKRSCSGVKGSMTNSNDASLAISDRSESHGYSAAGILEGTLENSYDHALCHDCACVPEIAIDCVDHFDHLCEQSGEVTGRLSMLVESREKVRDLWDLTHTQNLKENSL
jgi:hypothetical protein